MSKVVVNTEISRRGFNTPNVVTKLHGTQQWFNDHHFCPPDMKRRITSMT